MWMLIANIFRNILSKFYCLHKLLKIKSAGTACPMNNSRRPPLRLLRHHEKCLFMILLQPLSNFFFLSLCLPPKVMDSFPAFLPFPIFLYFVWRALKIFFMTFHYIILPAPSVLISTPGNSRTQPATAPGVLAFSLASKPNINSALFHIFLFLRRSISQTFSWLMKNNLNESMYYDYIYSSLLPSFKSARNAFFYLFFCLRFCPLHPALLRIRIVLNLQHKIP